MSGADADGMRILGSDIAGVSRRHAAARTQKLQAAAMMSQGGRLVYAVVAEKAERQMVKLTPENKAEIRRFVADGLVRWEGQDGRFFLLQSKDS